MNRIKTALCLVMALGLGACAPKSTRFGVDLIDDGLQLTAENEIKGTGAGSGIDVSAGDEVVVTANMESGAVTVRMVADGAEDPSVEWTFDGKDQEISYDLEPGNYMVGFTSAKDNTTGIITVKKKKSEKPAEEENGQNPIMNFVGTYANDRCSIEVQAADNKTGVNFTVTWGSSAAETSEWAMSGNFDESTMSVTYTDGLRKDMVFNEDGTTKSETIVYQNGKGTFTFGKDNTLTWKDEQEHAADDMVFTWAK